MENLENFWKLNIALGFGSVSHTHALSFVVLCASGRICQMICLSHTLFSLHIYSAPDVLWSWSSLVSLVTFALVLLNSKLKGKFNGGRSKHGSTILGRDLKKLPSNGKLLAVHVCLSVSGGRWRVEWSIPTAVARADAETLQLLAGFRE